MQISNHKTKHREDFERKKEITEKEEYIWASLAQANNMKHTINMLTRGKNKNKCWKNLSRD